MTNEQRHPELRRYPLLRNQVVIANATSLTLDVPAVSAEILKFTPEK